MANTTVEKMTYVYPGTEAMVAAGWRHSREVYSSDIQKKNVYKKEIEAPDGRIYHFILESAAFCPGFQGMGIHVGGRMAADRPVERRYEIQSMYKHAWNRSFREWQPPSDVRLLEMLVEAGLVDYIDQGWRMDSQWDSSYGRRILWDVITAPSGVEFSPLQEGLGIYIPYTENVLEAEEGEDYPSFLNRIGGLEGLVKWATAHQQTQEA